MGHFSFCSQICSQALEKSQYLWRLMDEIAPEQAGLGGTGPARRGESKGRTGPQVAAVVGESPEQEAGHLPRSEGG